jgi:hypothetical protein
MASNPTNDPAAFERLTADAMQRDFPSRFSSREEWDEYNRRLTARERSYEYRALHGDLDETEGN